MEIKKEVKVFQVHYRCDEKDCDGFLSPTGTCLTTNPLRYPHCCDKCGAMYAFPFCYPKLEYVDIGVVKEELHG